MRIAIVMPQGVVPRGGNKHTAARWAGFLREAGHRVSVVGKWDGQRADLLLALHARKSAGSVDAFRRAHPEGPIVLALTGTDLYRDIRTDAAAKRSLKLATRLLVLQPEGLKALPAPLRAKARVVFQSSDTRLRHAPAAGRFRVAAVGHLREEKDPFRAAIALEHVTLHAGIEVVQVGAALSPAMAKEARRRERYEPRYRWLGSQPHAPALRLMAQCHLLVVSSVMEGGANVISEAARIGLPILASRVPGNVGMLGAAHPGYFPLFDEKKLARLMARAATDEDFYRRLRRATLARRPLFAPAAERKALVAVLRELLPR